MVLQSGDKRPMLDMLLPLDTGHTDTLGTYTRSGLYVCVCGKWKAGLCTEFTLVSRSLIVADTLAMI